SYMALKLDVRIDLCRILYELVTTHTLELSLFAKCCVTLARMLRREEQLTADDIAFDWRQLYDLTHDTVVPKVWQDNPIQQRSKLKCIVELVCEANRFFPQSAAMEVLDELLPKIQFNSMDWQAIVIQLFTLFVPTARAPTGTSLVTSGAQSTDPQRWLPTIFSLWTFNLRMSVFDAYLMNLVTTLVLEQQGQLQLTNEQVRFVFASGLHFFNLPVSRSAFTLPRSVVVSITDTTGFFRMPANGMLPLKEERAHTFARFIVYTVHVPETLELFEQLVQMIEPFYHPSNNGSWSSMLARFLRYLAKELLQRSRAEAAEDCKVPQDARLTRKMRRRFVVPVRTLAMLLLFSKGEDAVSMSHSTLKHLAELEPDMIFRPLLDTLYTAVDSVTETHRMISAMRALAKLATTLSNFAHYPEGAQHVAPLLMLTLPGIDVNDPTKSYFALSFIYNLCHNGVVFDELVATGDMPTVRTASMEEDQDPEEPPELDMQQIEWTTRASTAQFEVWIDQYLRRVFALMDNLSSSLDSSAGQSTDIKLESMAAHATELVLIQSGARYHPMVARLITEFATSITSLSAVGGVSKVVSAFAGALPELALANLLPRCCEHITEEVANGVGQTPSLSRFTRSHADTTLIWYASMLAALTESQDGRPLLKYKEQLLHAIEQLVDTCQSRHVYSVGARLLYNTLAALTRTAPARGRSVAEDVWNSAEFRENHFRYWGRHPDVADPEFAIEWHVPNADEVAFAQELMRRIVEPRIGQLSAHINALAAAREPSSADSVTLHRLLVTLRFGIRGLGGMAPPPGAPIPDDALIDALIEGDDANGMPARRRLGLPVAGGYVFAAGSAGQIEVADIRRRAAEVAGKALEFVEQRSEGNVENSKAAILLTETAVCHHATERSTFASVRRTWDYGIDGFALDSSHSIMPRLYAERRAQLTHIARQLHNTRFVGAAESTNSLAAQLARLCLSAYSEVRSYAVSALDNVMAVAPQSKYALVPRFLDELGQSADSDPERMLGALRVLDTQPMRRACLRDWRFFPTMVLALCRAQHEDKPQVKKAIRNTAVVQVMHVTAPVEPAAPPAQVCEMVSTLSGSGVLLDAPVAASRAVCVERYDATVTAHAQLVDALLDILRDAGTTWRFAALAGYYLDQLTTVRTPPSPRLARTLAELLTSDLLLFRETSVLNLAQLLGVIKRRSKEACPDIAVAQRRRTLSCPEVIQPEADGPVADSKAYTDLCARALAGDADAISAPFVDNPAAGWLAWPTTAKAYIAPPAEAVEAYNRIDSASQAAYDAVRAELFADGKWDAIARLFAVEGAREAENEMFGTTRAQLFTQAFALFGSALLDRAWAAIEALAHDHERVSAQRAASELVGGLLRGSKHWSQAALDAMWARLVPLLDAAFARLRPDTLVFWQSALKYAFARRDPRRFVPVLRVLLYTRAFDPQAEAPFAEAAKLELLRIALGAWDWRV
ncbi:Proteasome activator BLM10, partial [Coemansia sp. RSA 2704]